MGFICLLFTEVAIALAPLSLLPFDVTFFYIWIYCLSDGWRVSMVSIILYGCHGHFFVFRAIPGIYCQSIVDFYVTSLIRIILYS